MKSKTIISKIIMISLILLVLPATSSASDQTLGIFGNANEDGTINMQDVTYTELIILEYEDQTELSDAKYDGEIDILDVTQIELIILGKEKELSIIDGNGEVVTVPKPVERIVVLYKDAPEILRALNAADRIVGVSNYIKQYDFVYLPEISKLPGVGGFSASEIDYEAVLSLNPDVLLTFGATNTDEIQEKLPGVTVIFLGLYFPDLLASDQSRYTDGVKKIGYILDKVEDAEKFTNWRDDWIYMIKSRTEKISDDERPLVYNTRYSGPTWDYRICCADYKTYAMTLIAGGKDIAENLDECGYGSTVDPEWLIEQNPDFIVVQAYYERTDHGYNTDDPSEMAATRDDIVNNPVLANINAVKNDNIYMMAGNFRNGGDGNIIGTVYMAKCFHPDLFDDLDPQAIHQEYLTEFQGLDFDLNEHGVFIYPQI